LFRVSFTTYSSRFGILAERYYFSVRTLGQTETIHGRQVPNLRPRLKVFWESELARHAVKARIQVCQLLLACRNADHIQAIVASPVLRRQRRGFTEVEHIARDLTRTHCHDLTFVSRQQQQQNVGRPGLYLRDTDPAVATAYRLSRQPMHLLSNSEYQNLAKITELRGRRPPLTACQLGGPLFAQLCVQTHADGHQTLLPLCEAHDSPAAR